MEGLSPGSSGVEYLQDSMIGSDMGTSGAVTYRSDSSGITEKKEGSDIAVGSLRMGPCK